MADPVIESVRVMALEVHDFKRIHNVRIVPLEPVTSIIGENEAGKSSCLDSICAVLGGSKWCPEMPVRRGAVDAAVRLDLDDIVAVRRWKAGGDKNGELTVYAKDGTPLKKPQDVLNRFISAIAFDPLLFERSPKAERLAMLAKVANVDLDDFARRRAKLYAERTDVNKDIKKVELDLSRMPPADDEIPTTEISVAAIMAKIEDAERVNKEVDRLLAEAAAAAARHLDAVAASTDLDSELNTLKSGRDKMIEELEAAIRQAHDHHDKAAAAAKEKHEKHQQTIATLEQKAKEAAEASGPSTLIDIAPLRDQIKRADSTNLVIRQQNDRRARAAEGNAMLKRVSELEAGMKAIDEEKIAAVAAAKLPIPGLSLGDEDVMMTGPDGKGRIPFEQCSSAQKLTLSAMIGLETNRLKLMLIHDGSLLDDKRMAALKEIATRYQAQIWVERVVDADDKDEVGVRITEGYTPEEYAKAQETKAAAEFRAE